MCNFNFYVETQGGSVVTCTLEPLSWSGFIVQQMMAQADSTEIQGKQSFAFLLQPKPNKTIVVYRLEKTQRYFPSPMVIRSYNIDNICS